MGIHSGDAIAGIIGQKRFQYDLCGDAVNTAARMCSYSAPGCVTVSPVTYSLVEEEYGTLYLGEHKVTERSGGELTTVTCHLRPQICLRLLLLRFSLLLLAPTVGLPDHADGRSRARAT